VATLLLRRAGATVIKVEEPGVGDYGRTMAPLLASGVGAVFRFTNAGKKSVALDLKSTIGRERFLHLASRADIVVEGFRPGVMERLRLGPGTLASLYPRLIYASLTGYRRGGTMAQTAGHDLNYVAMAGALLPPSIPMVQMADIAGGSLPLVNAILLALLERHRTGRGSRVDVSMTEGLEPLLLFPRALLAAGADHPLTGNYPCYNLYECDGGGWIAVGALEEKFWCNLCRALGRDDLVAAQWNASALRGVRDLFRLRTAEAWLSILARVDCCVSAVANLGAIAEPEEPAPSLGEHDGEFT
jgi:crotonobetainyl-CoA:carnitine CoA-transferase CaiB-like acyl-CoA transferase